MSLRNLPSVDSLLRNADELISTYGRPLTVHAIRFTLDKTRVEIMDGMEIVSNDSLLLRSAVYLSEWTSPTLKPLINATGVILHTNLGRAPLSQTAIRAMEEISNGYSNLEFDLTNGKRGSRSIHIETLLRQLTGAEAGLVVNNCASAVLLVLTALANRKKVVIPRSQLVEIGGGFRVPDVMKQSGARLIEIGTTNKVRLSDFEEALGENNSPLRSLVMRAHRSNFRIIGFTEEPDLNLIIEVAHKKGTIFIDDLGSGALIDTAKFGLEHEPTVQESLQAGADVVMFSGDKLLGGPQAGIILGRSDLIAKIKRHPLARAVRADKTCLAGLNATLLHYLKDEVEREIPLWCMISMPIDIVKRRAENWQREIGAGEVIMGESTIGGGSLPGESLPSWLLSLRVNSTKNFLSKLRQFKPALIARIQNDQILFDPRTVFPEQDKLVIDILKLQLARSS